MQGGGGVGGFLGAVGFRNAGTAIQRGGGQRKLGLPDGGDDPTDAYDARAALVPSRPLTLLDLMGIAVADKAIRDFRMYAHDRHPKRRVWFENARAYLFDADDPADLALGWPLTFSRVCERLDVDVDVARQAIAGRRGSRKRVRLRARRAA